MNINIIERALNQLRREYCGILGIAIFYDERWGYCIMNMLELPEGVEGDGREPKYHSRNLKEAVAQWLES